MGAGQSEQHGPRLKDAAVMTLVHCRQMAMQTQHGQVFEMSREAENPDFFFMQNFQPSQHLTNKMYWKEENGL